MNRQICFLTFLFLIFINTCRSELSHPSTFVCSERVYKKHEEVINRHLLSKNSKLAQSIKSLITDPTIFDSIENFQKSGFIVKSGHRDLMVGMHPNIPNYLIKKFKSNRSQKMQIDNFVKRIEGAQKVRNCIKKNRFKFLIVPNKWLLKLPSAFADIDGNPSYLLIVENMDIIQDWDNPAGTARMLYYNMDKEILTELCTALHSLGGCDAFPRNQPFTKLGKIAFVDTEHVGQKKEHFIKHIVPALNPELQAYAIALWSKLEGDQIKK